ncbi:hypothetical protein B0J17DRAFT_634376 [Rhizoctonia solani]|nr:hypothetical protein B0J17DRAFT_634376 [Rhizoctonia solani]
MELIIDDSDSCPPRHKKDSSLLGGFYGVLPSFNPRNASALLITIDYESSPRNNCDWANTRVFTLIGAKRDGDAMFNALKHTGFDAEDVSYLSNETASSSSITYELNRIHRAPEPMTIYNHRMEYQVSSCTLLNQDCLQDLQSVLAPRQTQLATQRLIITDVHFAAGSRNEMTYENNSGGIFTQAVCQVIKEPQTLPKLLMNVSREEVNKYTYARKHKFIKPLRPNTPKIVVFISQAI